MSRGPIVCREECIYKCIRIITTKWWLLKIEFGWKTTLGVRFFGFFTSKNIPPYGTCARCKFFFHTSRLNIWYQWGDHQLKLPQNDDFSKSCLGVKPLWGWNFLDFSLPFFSPHMGHVPGVNFFLQFFYSHKVTALLQHCQIQDLNLWS